MTAANQAGLKSRTISLKLGRVESTVVTSTRPASVDGYRIPTGVGDHAQSSAVAIKAVQGRGYDQMGPLDS
jgi:hypothetical protein